MTMLFWWTCVCHLTFASCLFFRWTCVCNPLQPFSFASMEHVEADSRLAALKVVETAHWSHPCLLKIHTHRAWIVRKLSVRLLSSFQVCTMPLTSSWEEFFLLFILPAPPATEVAILSNFMYACGVESPCQLMQIPLDELLSNDDTLSTNLHRCNTSVRAYMLLIDISSREYRDDDV